MNYKDTLFFILKIAISLVLLGAVLYYIGLDSLITEFKKADQKFLALTIFFVALQIIFKSMKWNTILKIFKASLKLKTAIQITCISLTFGFITPARIGEFIKAKYVVDEKKISYKAAIGSVIADKLFDFIGIIAIGLMGSVLIASMLFYPLLWPLLLISFIISLVISIIFLPKITNFLKSLSPKKYKESVHELTFTRRIFSKTLLHTILTWIMYVIECYCILLALHVKTPIIGGIMVLVSLMALSSALPISLGGLGMREWVSISFLPLIGIEATTAAALSLIFTMLSFGIPSLFGALFYLGYKPTKSINNQ